ncbi:mammalian ependymin-related protein 1-like isoform X1 [Heptranchias perlo]|uniref:mammalian ependymin-related protein 1-like isoform X1 n=1 Tax=Heptranchias perlo TaxID=212740 RepID=UPI00355A1B34
MKLLAALAICSLSFLVTEGGKPEPCSPPKLLEGNKVILDPSKPFLEFGRFSYDAVQKRVYFGKQVMIGVEKFISVEEFFLFEQAIMYRFHPQNRTCEKSALRTPFPEIAIPQNATFSGQVYIGGSSAPGEGVLANTWTFAIGDDFYSLTVTEFGCLLVSVILQNKEGGWNLESFNNLTTGIKDPSVFFPPSECNNLN